MQALEHTLPPAGAGYWRLSATKTKSNFVMRRTVGLQTLMDGMLQPYSLGQLVCIHAPLQMTATLKADPGRSRQMTNIKSRSYTNTAWSMVLLKRFKEF